MGSENFPINEIYLDKILEKELGNAGIEAHHARYIPEEHEVKSGIYGSLNDWRFIRAWEYWDCKGPTLTLEIAKMFHETFECAIIPFINPRSLNARTHYHIYTYEGLKVFANTLYELYGADPPGKRKNLCYL